MTTLINQHAFMFLCCIVWMFCGLATCVTKKEVFLQYAIGTTILIGIGWLLYNSVV